MSNLADDFGRRMHAQEAIVVENAGAENLAGGVANLTTAAVESSIQNQELIRARREDSLKKYPSVQVDADEYVVLSLRRHPVGIYSIVASAAAMLVVIVSAWILMAMAPNSFGFSATIRGNLSLIFLCFSALSILAAIIGAQIYRSNSLIITNERAIQHIVSGVFHQKKQVINLESVEDISFTKKGFFAHIWNYGTLKLSTVGEESTYTFDLVGDPAKLADIVGEICEAAKNKRILEQEIYAAAERISQ